ncbi:MAG: hypothetical protein GF307_10350 [candidate division Zixibacteria bacterium]|nr:hypothetical protein [candidate division Zixibacteria bacterium]
MLLGTMLFIATGINLYGRLQDGGELDPSELIRYRGTGDVKYRNSYSPPGQTAVSEDVNGDEFKTGNPAANEKININKASPKELIALPGVGPVIAQRIIEYIEEKGEIQNVKDLISVKGIGPKKSEELLKHITFE